MAGAIPAGGQGQRCEADPARAVAVGVVLPLVIGLVVYFSVANPFATEPELHSADGLTDLVASVRDHFGDATGYQLVVYPDYAILSRRSPTNEHAEQNFIYRGDEWRKWAPDSELGSLDHLADLGRFDAAGVSAALASAAGQLDINDATGTYLIVAGDGSGDLRMTVYVSAPASGRVDITPDGGVRELHRPGE